MDAVDGCAVPAPGERRLLAACGYLAHSLLYPLLSPLEGPVTNANWTP
jgi:hypothetical protein